MPAFFKLYPTCRFAPFTLPADMIIICTGCGGLRVTWHTDSGHLIYQSAQLLIAEQPSKYMSVWHWPSWHTQRVRELGVVARRHVESSDWLGRGAPPRLSALSSLTHNLHGLCPVFCDVVAQYRQVDVFGVHNECVPIQTALHGLQDIVAGAGAF